VGIVPLYYARAGSSVLFASEAKAIFASGRLAPRFSPAGLSQVFSRWAPSAPDSVFEGVRSVCPGEAVRFNDMLVESHARYWQMDFTEAPELADLTSGEAANMLADRLRRAVRLRLRADVPVGGYLSGGLDSSVLALLVRDAGVTDLQTFAIGFEDPAYDETPQQRRMAELLGTAHHEIRCGAAEIRDSLPEVIWHCEAPLLRTAPAPMYRLSRLVRDTGMKVVLAGEGADELLAGYHLFKEDRIRRFWARQPRSGRRPMLLTNLYSFIGQGRGQNTRLWQAFFRRGLEETDHPFYSHLVRWRNTAWSLRFLSPPLRPATDDDEALHANLLAQLPGGYRGWRPLARAQCLEMMTFLSAYLLTSQGDRMAMANSVEGRYPYLDPDVIDFCCRLPSRLKLRGLLDKVILRKLASADLPPEVWQRPKHPYRAPISRALFDHPPDYVRELLSESQIRAHGLLDAEPAIRLVNKAFEQNGVMAGEREEMALVGMLTLQMLARHFTIDFAERVRRQRARLDAASPDVCEDRLHRGQRRRGAAAPVRARAS
jgi:asparagine synthase (glutamine-hydrolysing)